MPTKRISQIFKDLSFDKKLLGIGSLLMIISVFLPWYQDLDSFKTGDMFMGITGPLYLAGLTLLILSIVNLVLIGMDFSGKKLSFFPVKNSSFYLFSGLIGFYILIVAVSVFFHAKFGINITLKQSQFGLFTAFIATSLITIGGYLSVRDKETILKEFQESTQEEFIKVPEQDTRKPDDDLKVDPAVESPKVEQTQMPEVNVNTTPEPVTEVVKETAPDIPAPIEESKTDPQPFRTDL